MYNKIILMGRIANDLEVKKTPNGISTLQFRIAVERSYKDANGERETDFIPCIAWRNNADFIAKYFSKGAMIHIEGELQNRQYTDKNGVDRIISEVIVSGTAFTGEKRNTSTQQTAYAPDPVEAPASAPAPAPVPAQNADFSQAEVYEDYPF